MQLALFIIFGALALGGALNLLLQRHPIHSALSLVVVMMSLAVLYWSLGAEFLAAAQVIVYSGAIMVLFVFVVMMLNLGKATVDQERRWLAPRTWLGPGVLSLALLCELVWVLGGYGVHVTAGGRAVSAGGQAVGAMQIGAVQVGVALFGPYVLAVELASMLLLAGLVAAFHLGRHE